MLIDAVRQGVALLSWSTDTFAYASAVDQASGRFSGLVAGEHPAVVLDAESVVVKPAAAAGQMDEVRAAAAAAFEARQVAGGTEATAPRVDAGGTTAEPAGPAAKTRFYGRVSVQPVRMLRDLGDIADAIVAQLGRADAEVAITVEIEASAKDGFDDDVRRTVSENARTLKFEAHEFEE
ncbi:MAG: hypothetical protein ACRDZ9_07490 [Acidimicrobiales bacterium]